MEFKKDVKTFKSSNLKNTIKYYVYHPNTEPVAIVQISHGMCEYIERYENFINFLLENSFIVCGNDHLGHGGSAESKDDFGYFSKKDGWICLYEDLYKLTSIMKSEYPKLKYFMFGHSMGSFVLRAYLTKYSKYIDGAIICGTSGGSSILDVGIFLAKVIRFFKGDRYRSKFIKKLSFMGYNKRYDNKRTELDWLTSDESVVDKALNDERYMFVFTVSAYIDMFTLLKFISKKDSLDNIRKDLPIFLITGGMDPVGEYGKGVEKVYNALKAASFDHVQFKIYENARHEILNESIKGETHMDLLQWIQKWISG